MTAPAPVRRRKEREEWRPLERTDLGYARVLGFDQTVRNTGVALVESTPAGCVVLHAETARTSAAVQAGWDSTLRSAADQADQLAELVSRLVGRWPDLVVVHELPAVGAAFRPESSILAALGVHLAARPHGRPVHLVQNQQMKRLVTGDAKATKDGVKRALLAMPWLDGREHLTNADIRDAAALALTWLAKRAPRGV